MIAVIRHSNLRQPDARLLAAWQTGSFRTKATSNKKYGTRSPAGGVNIMRILSLLLPVAVMLGVGAHAAAEETHARMDMPAQAALSAAHPSRWSDPASWPDGKVPGEGDAVTIGRDRA
uniref:hypothetical protein n=1 Tax=Altererythrobacter segetis TaxID=1104773 RepID=UPI00140E57E0